MTMTYLSDWATFGRVQRNVLKCDRLKTQGQPKQLPIFRSVHQSRSTSLQWFPHLGDVLPLKMSINLATSITHGNDIPYLQSPAHSNELLYIESLGVHQVGSSGVSCRLQWLKIRQDPVSSLSFWPSKQLCPLFAHTCDPWQQFLPNTCIGNS